MNKNLTLYPVHCLISMYQNTNLSDTYYGNDWIFQCSRIGVIVQNLCFEKTSLA